MLNNFCMFLSEDVWQTSDERLEKNKKYEYVKVIQTCFPVYRKERGA